MPASSWQGPGLVGRIRRRGRRMRPSRGETITMAVVHQRGGGAAGTEIDLPQDLRFAHECGPGHDAGPRVVDLVGQDVGDVAGGRNGPPARQSDWAPPHRPAPSRRAQIAGDRRRRFVTDSPRSGPGRQMLGATHRTSPSTSERRARSRRAPSAAYYLRSAAAHHDHASLLQHRILGQRAQALDRRARHRAIVR